MTDDHAVDHPPKTLGYILVVDDERNIRSTLHMVLTGAGYRVDVAANGQEAEDFLARSLPDVILLDVRLPGRTGLVLLGEWQKHWPQLPVILMSGEASLTEALTGLKHGAFDFLEKPILSARLLTTIAHAVRTVRPVSGLEIDGGESVIGSSPLLMKALSDAKKIAATKARVLITGESGTGKDVLARYIHQASGRAKNPFIKINCASIPADLVESELFGHAKGSFTGATSARRGHFESAHGGTLLLDEIGELPLAAQAKMLRTLQSGEVTIVGTSDPIAVDVRVIAATNRDLRAEVSRGTFREDLYYRIAVVLLESPALRERLGDISQLVLHFMATTSAEYGIASKNIAPETMTALEAYPWPGNIREVRNVVERMKILAGSTVTIADLPPEIASYGHVSNHVLRRDENEGAIEPWHVFKQRSERAHIERSLAAADGNISEAARLLGVERQTIHKWLKVYDIVR